MFSLGQSEEIPIEEYPFIGIDLQSRQAIGHYYVDPANCWLNLGVTLVMGWNEVDTIYLIKDHPTVGPGK